MFNKLEDIIGELIDLKYEGEYWDYKREWHKDKEELIKDIIAFTNTYHSKDCYLIIGVADNGDIIGVQDKNKKRQADLIDMINSCNFSGAKKPEISVQTILVKEKEIDILTIYDIEEIPISIKKRNGKQYKLNPGAIYTRVGDMNTPINETADDYIVEKLWKKRFRLETDIIEQYKKVLRDKWHWRQNKSGWYYNFDPNFNIIEVEEENELALPFYAYNMVNENTSYYNLELVYKGVEIDEYQEVVLDSGRYLITSPEKELLQLIPRSGEYYEYRYFVRDSLNFLLYDFLYREEDHKEDSYAKMHLDEILIIFNDNDESVKFREYAQSNLSKLVEDTTNEISNIYKGDTEYIWGNEKCIIGKYFKKMHGEFRKNIRYKEER